MIRVINTVRNNLKNERKLFDFKYDMFDVQYISFLCNKYPNNINLILL